LGAGRYEMRGWIRLGLVVTALWVVGAIVTVIYLGKAPTWNDVRQDVFAGWHQATVESETGRSVAEWDLQVRVARETCQASLAGKSISAERQAELCYVSPLYSEPSALGWVGIYLRAISQYAAEWLYEFLIPLAVWAFFVPFCVWFIGIASVLLVLRLRGDRLRAAERTKRIIH
jgi:hypothetical protein